MKSLDYKELIHFCNRFDDFSVRTPLVLELMETRCDSKKLEEYKFRMFVEVADPALIARHLYLCLIQCSKTPRFNRMDLLVMSYILKLEESELEAILDQVQGEDQYKGFSEKPEVYRSYVADFLVEGKTWPAGQVRKELLILLMISIFPQICHEIDLPSDVEDRSYEVLEPIDEHLAGNLRSFLNKNQDLLQAPAPAKVLVEDKNFQLSYRFRPDTEVSRWMAFCLFCFCAITGWVVQRLDIGLSAGFLLAVFAYAVYRSNMEIRFRAPDEVELLHDEHRFSMKLEDILRVERLACKDRESLRIVFRNSKLKVVEISDDFKRYSDLINWLECSELRNRVLYAHECLQG